MNYTLQVKNIHKKYGKNEILKGVSLNAQKGDIIAILGSSGSGKSTFLRCLNLLEKPNEGEIFFHNKKIHLKKNKNDELTPVDQNQLNKIRSKIGFVFQNFNLWPHMTVLANIMLAPKIILKENKKDSLEYSLELLKKVGMIDKKDFYPSQLSGGGQQRIAIARALAIKPEILLFDEPTSSLDPEMIIEVLNVIKKIADEGATMILVTHELNFAKNVANRILFLHQGLIEEEGTPKEIFENCKSERVKQFIQSHREL